MSGNDTVYGGDGSDIIEPGSGTNQIYGGSGDDILRVSSVTTGYPTPAPSYFDGGSGRDSFDFSAFSMQPQAFWSFDSASNRISVANYQMSNVEVLYGGSGRDVFNFGLYTGRLSISAGAGDDEIMPGRYAEYVDAGAGNDKISLSAIAGTYLGGSGDDLFEFSIFDSNGIKLDGQDGIDTLTLGYSGVSVDLDTGQGTSSQGGFTALNFENVIVVSGISEVVIYGSAADNTFTARSALPSGLAIGLTFDGRGGNDALYGGMFSDTLYGGSGDDLLSGGNGNDRLYGEEGNDLFIAGAGSNQIDGGADTDYVSYVFAPTALTVDLQFQSENTAAAANDSFVNTEGIIGSDYDDSLRGDSGNNHLIGQSGNDWLYGRGGNDILNGGSGADILHGGEGFDLADYSQGHDAASPSVAGVTADLLYTSQNQGRAAGDIYLEIEGIMGSELDDSLRGDDLANYLKGNMGNDVLFGRDGNDTLLGDDGNDQIFGESGSDYLNGGNGADILYGGAGSDVLDGGNGQDAASYRYASGDTVIDLAFVSHNTGEASGDTYYNVEMLEGSAFNDSIRGDAGQNTLLGGSGNDTLYGREGDDWLYGQAGDDFLSGGSGNDYFVFQPGDGSDYLLDFEEGNGVGDVLALSKQLGVTSYADVQARATQYGNNVFVQFDEGSSITFLNTNQWSLSIDDFTFF
ncbi:MAG: calcium-binding protein [Sphingobium sp.]|nr:calcium-binding protein [Sphingobium sp.]